ncbi:MAG: hypothetical protein R3B47_07575 [Bacteroidia bacterium]
MGINVVFVNGFFEDALQRFFSDSDNHRCWLKFIISTAMLFAAAKVSSKFRFGIVCIAGKTGEQNEQAILLWGHDQFVVVGDNGGRLIRLLLGLLLCRLVVGTGREGSANVIAIMVFMV